MSILGPSQSHDRLAPPFQNFRSLGFVFRPADKSNSFNFLFVEISDYSAKAPFLHQE